MNGLVMLVLAGVVLACGMADAAPRIDRQALVRRHAIRWDDPTGEIPLGNGNFCFNADGTGLQTFTGVTMAHWGWHSYPLPEGWTADRVPRTGTFAQGRPTGPDHFPPGTDAIRTWMFDNPHRMNLARIRLVRPQGAEIVREDIVGLVRTLDPWTGRHSSRFTLDGQPVSVETCVDWQHDTVAAMVVSPLLTAGRLTLQVDFPYPALGGPWCADWSAPAKHRETTIARSARAVTLERIVDDARYTVQIDVTGARLATGARPHTWSLCNQAKPGWVLLSVGFGHGSTAPIARSYGTVTRSASSGWRAFWRSGGCIDLSGSTDPRWNELERRIVLAQYLLRAQSAGDWPPAETGLMGLDPWRGQFHMEMVWWHLAHYGLWQRWDLAANALDCYRKFLPSAQALARQLGLPGAKWGKSVGPEGRSAPWVGNQVLLWKQPHPIFFAEMSYRLKPTPGTVRKWLEIVTETAENMAGYARPDAAGVYHLDPVMPPSEQGFTRDTVFDLAYWRWGLATAQAWLARAGRPRNPDWDKVLGHLAPLPVVEGAYVHSAEWHDTYTARAWEHPDPIGHVGMLPPVAGTNPAIGHATVLKLWDKWNWGAVWGWDFPWMAMAAARSGEPGIAVEALLKTSDRNIYDMRGVNIGGPCPYLPGNGGLLYAVAMMAAGWDGCPNRPAPGFPNDGKWVVRYEGLGKAL